MSKISLHQDENLSFKVSYESLPLEQQRLDLYFSLPEEMGVNPSTLNEEDYFHSGIKSHCAYYSAQVHLPLVKSRYISQKKGEQSDYRTNLNLFAYQYRKALETDIKLLIKSTDAENFYIEAIELADQSKVLLKKLRRYTPTDQKLSSYFENVDNFLSWYTEQAYLSLLASSPKTSDSNELRDVLMGLCREECQYRNKQHYNSQLTTEDPNRITNKMRLLRRLSEYGVVFSKSVSYLNLNLKRLVRGTITTVIMTFVMYVVLNTRSAYNEVTMLLIVFLGFIYGIREIFKEDLTSYLWRKIQRGRPRWQLLFTNSFTKNKLLSQTLWLEFVRKKDLPESVDQLLQKRRQQNKQAAQLLHFRCDTKVQAKAFMPGFDEVQTQVVFNLTPFVRYLKKGEGRLYSLDGNKISNKSVERRYQINLVVAQSHKKNKQYLQRFKITLNRSKIINIEAMEGILQTK